MLEGLADDVGLHRLAVDAQRDQEVVEALVLAEHRPAVAVAAERLGREEGGGGDVGPVDRVLAVERAAEALGGIGDQLQAVLPQTAAMAG